METLKWGRAHQRNQETTVSGRRELKKKKSEIKLEGLAGTSLCLLRSVLMRSSPPYRGSSCPVEGQMSASGVLLIC